MRTRESKAMLTDLRALRAGKLTRRAAAESRTFQMLLLTLSAAAAAYAKTAVSPLQETMRIALGLTDNQMALLQGPALALPMIVVAIPLGLLIDRSPRVPLLIGFALLNLVGSVLTAFAHSFAALFVTRCVIGLTAFAITPIVVSLFADLFPPTQRGRSTMIMTVGQYAGAAAVFALGGNFLAMSEPGPDGWRWAMLALCAPLVPVLVLTLLLREPHRIGHSTEKPAVLEHALELRKCRALFFPLLSGVVTIEVALSAALVWAAPSLARHFGLSPERVGSAMALVLFLSGLLGTLAGGFLADLGQRSGGPRRTIGVLAVLAALSLPAGLFAVTPGVIAGSVLLLLFVAATSAICVVGTTLSTVVIPAHLRGLCLAILFAAGAIFGVGLAPMVVSVLSKVLGGPTMIGTALAAVCVLASLVSATTLFLSRRGFDRAIVQ